jgi:hypothetical protein
VRVEDDELALGERAVQVEAIGGRHEHAIERRYPQYAEQPVGNAAFGSVEKFVRSVHLQGQQTPPPLPPIKVSLPTPAVVKDQVNISQVDGSRHIHRYAEGRGFSFGISSVRLLLASLRSKPFVILAGNSGTGKSRLVRLFAEASGATVANGRFTMIPVRPDWNDSSELLGFFDLGGSFIPGQLIARFSWLIAIQKSPSLCASMK